jgi:hypothetical protein
MLARRCSTLARRAMSPNAAALSTAASGSGLQAAKLEVHRTQSPKTKLPKEKLLFGKTFTDHMLEVDWVKGQGWGNPVIRCVGMAIDRLAVTRMHAFLPPCPPCVQSVRPVLARPRQCRLSLRSGGMWSVVLGEALELVNDRLTDDRLCSVVVSASRA